MFVHDEINLRSDLNNYWFVLPFCKGCSKSKCRFPDGKNAD